MSQLAFAFGAGMLSTVNPCGFAMLPAFLAFYVGAEDSAPRPTPQRLAQGLRVGLVVSAGFAGVFTVAGVLVALGLRSIVTAVPWLAVVIGAVLVVLGLAMLAGRHVGLTINASRLSGTGAGLGRMAAFGAAYALTSLSCTLAVLLAVVAQALATASLASTLAVFVAYGAGAATVLILLALSAAIASGALARNVRHLLPVASRLGGAVLTASGLYLVAYWAPVLAGDRSGTVLTNGGGRLSGALSNLVEGHEAVILAAAVAAVAAAVVVRLLAGDRTDGDSTDGGACSETEAEVETAHHQGDTHA